MTDPGDIPLDIADQPELADVSTALSRVEGLFHEDEVIRGFMLDVQEQAALNELGRATTLEALGAMTEAEVAVVELATFKTHFEIKHARREIDSISSRMNDALFKEIKKSSLNVESLVRRVLNKELAHTTKELEKANQTADDLEKAASDHKTESDELATKISDDPMNPEAAEWRAELRVMRREQIELNSKAVVAHAEAIGALEAHEAAALEVSNVTRGKVFQKMADLSKDYLVDIEKAWDGVKALSEGVHHSGELITKGYKIYYEKFAQGADEASLYWARAQGFADTAAASESKVYTESLKKLLHLAETDQAAFQAALARFATPSSRMFIMTQQAYVDIRDRKYAYEFMRYLNPEWVGLGVKSLVRLPIGLALKTMEAVLGPEAVSGLAVAFTSVLQTSGSVLRFLTSGPVLVVVVGVALSRDILRDGITWKFADDMLGYIGLSLERIGAVGEKLKEYPMVSREIFTKEDEPPQLTLLRFDAQEMAAVIDFWGDMYIRLKRKAGRKYPPYKNLTAFKAIVKVPGLYIDEKHHPFETQKEIDDNNNIESLVEGGGFARAGYYSSTQVDAFFPRKKGFIRNLRDFPVYEYTFQWPDPKLGIPVQRGGNFSIHDMDPTIVALFQLWATSGTFGPIYNASPDKHIRARAVRENQRDLDHWLNPQPSWPTAWQEISTWIKGLNGMRAIMYSDMLWLAPEEWLKEWDVDLHIDDAWKDFFDLGDLAHPSRDFMNKKAYDQSKALIGRYTYRPRDRKFLEEAAKGRVLDTAGYSMPYSPFPSDAVELYPFPFGDAGLYAYYRDAAHGEAETYRKILEEGNKWKTLLDKKKTESAQAWRDDIIKQIWKDYVRYEKPMRTVWGYVSRYRKFFIEELMYVCNVELGVQRTKAWADYIRLTNGMGIPLHMNSAKRVAWMARFAQSAYTMSPAEDGKFIHGLEKQFKKIIRNDLVTTAKDWKNIRHWAHAFTEVVIEQGATDIPLMFGDLHARMFVLDKPRVIVIALKGSTVPSDYLIDMDFATGEFVTPDTGPNVHNTYDLISVEKNSKKSVSTLTAGPLHMSVHRGFLRAARALQPGIIQLLNKYFKEIHGIQDIFITGHSLGAAMGQLLAMMIPRLPVRKKRAHLQGRDHSHLLYKNPHCYNFSSPAVGDERFQKGFTRFTGETVQVWTDGDIVTALPPFLLPSREQSIDAWNDAIKSIQEISKENLGFSGLLWVMNQGFKHFKLPPQFDLSNLFKDFRHFDKSKLEQVISEVANAANENRALRGGDVFLRIDNDESGNFVETTYDSGNSTTLYHVVATSPSPSTFFADAHKLDNIIRRFAGILQTEPDLFALDVENLPSWADGGSITPASGGGGDDTKIPKSIAKQLQDGTATIIGYAHTKHHHTPWTIVPKEDVDREVGVFMARDPRELFRETHPHADRVKRRRVDKHDSTYRSSDYM